MHRNSIGTGPVAGNTIFTGYKVARLSGAVTAQSSRSPSTISLLLATFYLLTVIIIT